MKKTAMFAVLMGLVACGSDSDGGGVTFPDAGGGTDGTAVQACNPVTQQGCAEGEKCAALTESETPLLRRTACVPNGTVPPNGTCSFGEAGPSGYDDCMAVDGKGYHCRGDVCSEICGQGPPSTCSDGNCVLVHQLFDDIGDEANVGLCAARCDSSLQDCEADSQACYLSSVQGTMSCSRVPDEARGRLQQDDCYGPMTGQCFLNGCDEGYGASLNDVPMNATKSVCAFFCNPDVDNRGGSPTGINVVFDGTAEARPNGPGPSYHCRYINTFYSNTQDVPDHIGMAVDPLIWDTCDNHVPGDQEQFVPGCEPVSALQTGIPTSANLPQFVGKLVIPEDVNVRLGK